MYPIPFDISKMKSNEKNFSLGTVIIHILDKTYQEINFRSPLNSALCLNSTLYVYKEKYCLISICLNGFYFTVLVCADFFNEIEIRQL